MDVIYAGLITRRDTQQNWVRYNPVLAEGEWGYSTDSKILKIGDGVHRWSELETATTVGIMSLLDNLSKEVINVKDIADDSVLAAREAVLQATAAKESIKNLEGLANADTAQQFVADNVVQISQNTLEIQALKNRVVVLTEEEYNNLATKEPDRIYFIIEK